jgi:hypothetical protein
LDDRNRNFSLFYFFTPPQSGKPEVLLQIAVRLTVEIEIENDVMVFVPNETRNRLAGLSSGNLYPGSITNGIIEGCFSNLGCNSPAFRLKLRQLNYRFWFRTEDGITRGT